MLLVLTTKVVKLVIAGAVLLPAAVLVEQLPTSAPPHRVIEADYKGAATHGRTVAQLRHLRKAAGITWFRDDALWSDVQPQRGVYRWGRLDHLFRTARAAKMNVLLIIAYGTSWSGTPPNNADYASFARAVADRYHGFGGKLAFEFWNEPYMSWTWGGQRPDPVKYAAMVRAAASAVRSRGYGIQLMANVDVRNYADGSGYFEGLLNADPKLYKLLDAWSMHPYASNCSPLSDRNDSCLKLRSDWRFDRIPRLQSVARAHGASRPIWVTEFGWSTCSDSAVECVPEEIQASYTAHAIARARKEWGVQKLFVYTGDRDGTSGDRESHYGLYRHDGSEKPVLAAIGRSS